MPTDVELAYIAGFFDGEGCVNLSSPSLVVHLTNTNREVLDWVQSLFGGKVYLPPRYSIKHKQSYRWHLHKRDVTAFLTAIQPYVRIKQIQVVLGLGLAGINAVPGHPLTDRQRLLQEVLKEKLSIANAKGPKEGDLSL